LNRDYILIGDEMKDRVVKVGILVFAVFLVGILAVVKFEKIESEVSNSMKGTVLSKNKDNLVIQDTNNAIYTFKMTEGDVSVGEHIVLEYMGVIDKLKNVQDNKVISIQTIDTVSLEKETTGIFSKFYKQAQKKLEDLSTEEKIKQLLLVRYNDKAVDALGGFVFFEKDFQNKEENEVISMINGVQEKSKIPLLTAVDEEGGKIVRISSNSKLRTTKFRSSKDLYDEGGFNLIAEDTVDKSKLLKKLGLNVNLAPVVDIADDVDAYMYERTIGKGKEITADYAKTVINASKGTDVSYTLKHFPGYGNNTDTHLSAAEDIRDYDTIINNDLIPFKAGIEAGAEAVLVSHNIVKSIDADNPASLSASVHNLLKVTLGFTGITITDALDMGALKDVDDLYVKALLAGNELLIVTDYEEAIKEIQEALTNKQISENVIDDAALKVLAWKYYKGLMIENEK